VRIVPIETGWRSGSSSSRKPHNRFNLPVPTGEGFPIYAKQIFGFLRAQRKEVRREARQRQRLAIRRWSNGIPRSLLNNLSPRNRALGYRRVIPLIGIAPIPNRGCGCPGIGGVTIAIVIATVIGSRC
jgi:hypothetical protein